MISNMDLISVIVPVYNVEEYLECCVASILNQSYSDLEVILVDDGSTDNSPDICDKLKRKDHRIVVIHQENLGGGSARNAAMNIAKGKYIAFVDSDDFIASDMYEKLISCMTDDIDIVECEYCMVGAYDRVLPFVTQKGEKQAYTAVEAMTQHINDVFFKQLIWNKLYKSKILEGIRFTNAKGIDDEFWTYKAIGNAKMLFRIPDVLYAYRQQNKSVMHTIDVANRLDILKAKIERIRYLEERYPELKQIAVCDLWYTALYLGQLVCIDEKIRGKRKFINDIYDTIKKYGISGKGYTWKEMTSRLWLLSAEICFPLTCWIRSKLKIGM